PFDEKIAAPLPPRNVGAAFRRRIRPVARLDQHDSILALRSRLAGPAKIAGYALSFDQLGVIEELDRPERLVVAGDPGDARHYPSFPIAAAVSTMRLEKPHSLSYQLSTRTSLPSITAVSRLSMV